MSDEDKSLLADYADTEFVKRLHEKLTPEQIAFVVHLLKVDKICGMCFDQGPWCCYDEARDYDE